MGKAASKLGWLIFLFALAGAVFRTGPDDPTTAAMKSSGAYQPFLVITWSLVGLCFIRAAFIMRSTVAMGRKLDELRRRKGKG
jgi:hypothetical protein